jgi:hypothetical protein
MTPFDLIPSITTDGRHVVLRAVPVTRRERLRRLARRLGLASRGAKARRR